jgi:hypothetical protein
MGFLKEFLLTNLLVAEMLNVEDILHRRYGPWVGIIDDMTIFKNPKANFASNSAGKEVLCLFIPYF